MKIGVMDSGVGGISTLREIVKLFPNDDIIYYGDCKNAPYGNKNRDEIYILTENIINYFINCNVDYVVIACNTASIASKEKLRRKYSLPILALEPAVKLACDNNFNKKDILVLATKFTINSYEYEKNVEKYKGNFNIISIAIPEFVVLVENIFKKNHKEEFIKKEVYLILDKYLSNVDIEKINHIVLGCTHFPFLKKYINEYFFDKNININFYDGNISISKYLFKLVNGREVEQNFDFGKKSILNDKIKFINSLGDEYLDVMEKMFVYE